VAEHFSRTARSHTGPPEGERSAAHSIPAKVLLARILGEGYDAEAVEYRRASNYIDVLRKLRFFS